MSDQQPWESTASSGEDGTTGENGTKFTYNPEDVRTSNHKDTYATTWGNAQSVLLGSSTGYIWQGKIDTTASYSHATVLGTKSTLDVGLSTAVALAPKLDFALAPYGYKFATGHGWDVKLLDDKTFKLKEGWKYDNLDKQIALGQEAVAVKFSNAIFDETNRKLNESEVVAKSMITAGLKSEMATSKSVTVGNNTYNAGAWSLVSPFSSITGVTAMF
jgi:hypothetical protein